MFENKIKCTKTYLPCMYLHCVHKWGLYIDVSFGHKLQTDNVNIKIWGKSNPNFDSVLYSVK